MKTFAILILALFITAITTITTIATNTMIRSAQASSENMVVAMSGCCKESDGGDWFNIHRDFDRCVEDNAEADGDDVFAPEGEFWWDARC